MPAIGATLREWTLFLLLCSISTPAYTQTTNETATVDSRATASSSTTTPHAPPTVSTSTPTTRTYIDSETTCPYRTVNYITHTLPQQCAKSTWSAPGKAGTSNGTAVEAGATPSLQTAISKLEEAAENSTLDGETGATSAVTPEARETSDSTPESGTASTESEHELETDSPFDNANFLSFEEWKSKNLAQVGQSPENVGQGRAAPSDQPGRRRPVNVNALDALGDEGEIELDFSGFGTPVDGEKVAHGQGEQHNTEASKATEDDKKATPSSWALSKDAGKTCKERFNFASFDCAATVLKTNKQAKSATSVLVENKDSYMLNECSADNKFLIVELCDDILVDTIVLANYEFFSSMFRHFRISVSDRYPVKMERWRVLATFEARNSRAIQPFLITEPQIWARYLRIEFLSQYGNEFYCPLSLLRVHGTTMMEQFRREEEEARGIDDDVDLETEQEVIKPAVDSGPIPVDQVPVLPLKNEKSTSDTTATAVATQTLDPTKIPKISTVEEWKHETYPSSSTSVAADIWVAASNHSAGVATQPQAIPSSNASGNVTVVQSNTSSVATPPTQVIDSSPSVQTPVAISAANSSKPLSSAISGSGSSVAHATVPISSTAPASKATNNSTAASAVAQPKGRASPAQPNPAVPSTQESFFKSIHKRLTYLEANSTLSLQYIEEQSRTLRDAFVKVEKRQLAKTEKFLDHLNSTVMLELQSFRAMYDQLWQSTVIELESMKERQKNEMGEIGTRLGLMADELVWQKRMAVVQSTLLLLCLGLVLFVRSGTLGSAADVPIVQQLGSKYNSFFESSPPHSPPESGIARRRRTLRNMWRSDTSAGLSDHHSDGPQVLSDAETDGARSPVDIQCSPPTPTTPGALAGSDLRNGVASTSSPSDAATTPEENGSPDDQAKRLEVLETQSGPATPNGSRDSRPSWEEVDRAMDQLKAEKTGQPSPRSTKKNKKKKRSPLRRAHSSFDAAMDDSPPDDSGDGLFLE
ncbi:hypothetical protein CC86DRAFT_372085 [Ophiobolus disseminans]|uniref:SUN domain-containing protein n=1 Tax=Ophiobolus disseminans TaxID=1469910 RepID=A0A6A6ZS62_9PLEO|nr:hypothetical protein CC86DRAFT_372085 [Ophiobolus disseminans]